MKRLVIVFSIFMCTFVLYAQNSESRNRGVIAIGQSFHGWTHCHWDGKPTFGRCTISSDEAQISCNLTSSKDKDTIAIAQMFASKSGVIYLDKEKTKNQSLKIVHYADHIDNNKSEYTIDTLHVGFNRSKEYNKTDHCIGTKDEGYEVYTIVIVDNPVEIIPQKDNSSLSIDDNEKCELLLNDFYVSKTTEFYLSVKLTSEGDDSWRTVKRTFKSKQEIALSYDEILSIAGITDKFAWSGKNISIKIAKKLIDGTWSESNVVLCTFIHHGPDFEIETVRRTACSDNVELIVKSERLGTYPEDKFKWVVMQKDSINAPDSTAFCPQNVKQFEQTSTPNVYKLTVEDSEFFSRSIIENPDKLKPWFLQLQSTDYKEAAEKFTTKEFEIAPRAPQITISQYTDEGTEVVESGINPYVRIKIEDLDTYYENGRVPYKVYEVDESGEHYLTEFNNRINTEYSEAQLKSEFNSQYSKFSWNITEESYKRSKFHEWYDDVKDKNNGLDVRTIISSQKFEIEAPSQLPALDNVICNGKVLYYYNDYSYEDYPFNTYSKWGRIMFSTEHPFSVDNQNNKPVIKINGETYYIEESSGNLKKYTANQSVDVQIFGYCESVKFDFLAQASNAILVCKDNVLRIFMFDSNNVWAQTDVYSIQNYFKNPEVYFVLIEGQPYINIKNNGITYCSDGKQLYDATTLYTPNSISEIKMRDGLITYVSNGTTYNQSKEAFSKGDLFFEFKKNKAVIPKTHFDSDWAKFQEEREKEYAKYLAENLSYKVSGLKYFTEDKTNGDVVTCTGKLKVQDVDSCYSNVIDYKFQYRKVKFDIEVSTYPSTLSANDGVVKLTLDKGGLAPYIVNDSSLNIGDVVEVSGCGYGEKKIMVKDGKGNEFPHSIYIPLPDYEIEPSNQICSERGGKIVLTCKNEALKLNSYFLYRQGEYINKYTVIDNGKTITFSGLKPDNYQVWGVFDNGNHVLLSESQTIADESFSVDVTVENAKEIYQSGTIALEAKNVQGNVIWQEFIDNKPQPTGKEGTSISFENVAIGEHKYFIIGGKDCIITKSVEVFGPEISMDVDIEADGDSAYVKIEDIDSQNISDYHFEVNGQKIENFSKVPYDKTQMFTLDLKYQTTPQGEVHTYNIIDQKLNSGTISISDASDKERCSGTDGQLKIVAEDIPENVKCYYQIANVSEGETELTNGTHDVSASIGEKVVYVRQEQTFSKGQINVNIHHDSQYSVNIADGTPTDAIVIAHDVKCHGANDGYIEIVSKSGESLNNVWLCQDVATLENTDVKKTCISSLQPGEYDYYVVDERCPSLAQKYTSTIQSPSEKLRIENMVIISSPTCHENDGKIELEIKGGWGDYIQINDYVEFEKDKESYLEDKEKKNSGLFFLDKLSSGKQHFVIVDKLLCELHIDTILPEYTSPQIISAAGEQTSCNGNADGKIIIDSVKTDCTVENSPLSLIIRDSSDTISISIPYQTVIEQLSKGSYELKIIDKNKCTSEPYFVTITEPEPVKVDVYVFNDAKITYKGGDDGKMNIIVSGGNEGLNTIYYGDTSICLPTNVLYSVEGLRAGMIDISATDEKGCSSNMVQVTFDEPKQALSIETETEPALCHAMTGAVKVKTEGGWGNYGIKLVGEREERNITEQEEVTFEGLSAGDYEITVTDERGAKIRQTVRVNAPEPIDHTLIITPDQCEGNGVGEITLSGGTPEYRSLFNMETDTIRGGKITLDYLKGGRDYTLTTWDANHCESKMTFSVSDEQLKAEIKHEYNNDGVLLTADVTGGVKPITYNWYNKSKEEEVGTTSQIAVNQSGLYLLEVTDISDCMRSVMKSVLMSGSLSMRVKSVKRATNIANDNGMAEIICHATQSPNVRLYHLESDTWKTDISMSNDTVIILRGLQSGHYYVEGNFGNGNIQTTEFTIEPYKEMELLSLNIKHVSEPNKNDARVVAYIEGGIAPYKVEGTYFATKYIELNGIKSGLYTMTIADSTGNKFTKEIEILEPEKLKIDISEKNDATCNSSSDGFVKLKATGGWGEYQFAVEEGDYKNSAYIGQLKAGERQFKVIDKYGIEDSVRVTIGEPDPLRATLVAIDSVSCKGLRDGAVYFDVIGGTAPYRTIYEKETLEGVVVTNLSSDNYNMTFTDSHSCISKDTIHVNIPEPELLEVAKAEVNNTTCELDNGKIALEIQGGSLPYSFEWSENGKEYLNAKNVGVKRSEALELKRNGLYTVTVKDKNGCTTHYERRIATSTNPRVKNVKTIDVLCYGSSDGVAIVDSANVVYGEPRASYHLTWPQGQEGVMSVNTLSAGTYKVRITDENNCTTTTEFVVGTPEPVKNQLVNLRDALCYGYNDGRIETNTIGGVGNYKYVWSTGESTSFADSLKAGQYMVVVADNHECRDTAVYTVAEPEKLTVELGDDALICPGNSYTFDAGEYAKYEWRRESNDSIIETNRQLTTNQGGEYYILVKNEKGCIAQDTIFLGIGEDALVANFLVSSNITISDTIVAIELSNMPVDSIRWEYDETAFIDITADEDESYIKKIRSEKIGTRYITMWAYSGGCMSSDTKQIEVYDIIEEYDSFNLGYDPLIKSVKIAPNPNNGEFFLLVTLREKYDVEVQINDVTTGHVVEKRKLTESDRYEEYINIRTWGSGIYVLSITAGEERRVVKILSVN